MTSSIAEDPYASPKTSDLDSATVGTFSQPQLFSFNGRIGRMRYFSYLVLSSILLMFVAGIAAAMLLPVDLSASLYVYGAFFICITVYGLSLNVRRLHDLDKSGWWSFLMALPILNLLLMVYLVFFPGSKRRNGFGDKPTSNGIGVFIAFALSLLLSFAYVGTLMAIALPAYQEYVERAQQAAQ